MCFNFLGIRIEIKFLFVAVAALLLLLDVSGVMLCAFLSSAVHELAHLAVLLAFKGEITAVTFEAFGIRIARLDSLLFFEELIVLLAGPLTNILVFFICGKAASQTVSLIGAVNLSIGIFNLLPVGALDGGRMASLILMTALGENKGRCASAMLSLLIIIPLFIAGVVLVLRPGHNFSLLLVCLFLAFGLVVELRAKNTQVMI